MNLLYRTVIGKATLEDQDEALKDPWTAHEFALRVPGADIERCQEAACKNATLAYWFAIDIKGADIGKIKKLCPQIGDKIDYYFMNRALI